MLNAGGSFQKFAKITRALRTAQCTLTHGPAKYDIPGNGALPCGLILRPNDWSHEPTAGHPGRQGRLAAMILNESFVGASVTSNTCKRGSRLHVEDVRSLID